MSSMAAADLHCVRALGRPLPHSSTPYAIILHPSIIRTAPPPPPTVPSSTKVRVVSCKFRVTSGGQRTQRMLPRPPEWTPCSVCELNFPINATLRRITHGRQATEQLSMNSNLSLLQFSQLGFIKTFSIARAVKKRFNPFDMRHRYCFDRENIFKIQENSNE